MKNVFDLSGKVAIVTGASTGLGAGMTLGLAEAGADIALVDRAGSPETTEQIRAMGRRALDITADLSTIAPASKIVEQTVKKFVKIYNFHCH